MEASNKIQSAPKLLPKPAIVITNPNQVTGRQLFLQKKPVVIRLLFIHVAVATLVVKI